MKVVILSVCLWATVSGGSVAWPGGAAVSSTSVVRSIAPQTKLFGFSTTQFINTVPGHVPVHLQPQLTYEFPQIPQFAPVHQAFYPVSGPSYYPSTVFYPSVGPIAPVAADYPQVPLNPQIPLYPQIPGYPQVPGFPQVPGYPQAPPTQPAPPQQDTQNPPGDADTAVVDSADFPNQNQEQLQSQPTSTEAPQQSQQNQENQTNNQQADAPQEQSPPSNDFPTFPGLPQIPQVIPSYPSLPQFPDIGLPSFPSIPQFPQGSLPSFPQLPQFPSNDAPQSSTPSPTGSYPGSSNDDKGLNDEDTISVESA